MNEKHKCIFCDNTTELKEIESNKLIDCPQCGNYRMTDEMFEDFKDNLVGNVKCYLDISHDYFSEKKHIISYCIRKEYENDSKRRVCTNKDFLQAAINTKELTFKEQLYSIMIALDKDSPYRGGIFNVKPENLIEKYTALSQCKNIKQLQQYIREVLADEYKYVIINKEDKCKLNTMREPIVPDEYKGYIKITGKGLEFIENNTKSLKHTSYDEALDMLYRLKDNIENKDCYRILYEGRDDGANEKTIGYLFKLMPHYSEFNINPLEFDINSEANNGRGSCDFKISYGRNDATIVEFKLGRNFKGNIEEQVEIYKKASNAQKGISVIVCYTEKEIEKIKKFIKEKYNTETLEHIIIIDAIKKVSASNV